MKSYKIVLKVEDAGGIYTAQNSEEANEIAQRECHRIWQLLDGDCGVYIENVEEVIK